MKPIVGTDKYKISATATVECNVQQLDVDAVSRMEGTFGQEYVLFCDPSISIKDGDRVVCKQTSEEFVVKKVILAGMFGIDHFKQVYLTKYNGN
jgi:hypothetical protein